MSKKNLVAILALVTFLVGCEWDVSGKLTANQQLAFNFETSAKKMKEREKKGKELYKILPAGVHAAELEFGDKHMDLKANQLEIRFLMPKDAAFPKYGGHLAIAAAQTAQPYDLSADVELDITESSRTRGTEACSESIPYEDCSCSAEGQVTCSRRTAYVSGDMDVEYYYRYTDREIKVQLLNPGTQEAVGHFEGNRVDSNKIYTYKSQCHIDQYKIRNIIRTDRHQVRNCYARQKPDQRPDQRPDQPARPGDHGPGRRDRPGRGR